RLDHGHLPPAPRRPRVPAEPRPAAAHRGPVGDQRRHQRRLLVHVRGAVPVLSGGAGARNLPRRRAWGGRRIRGSAQPELPLPNSAHRRIASLALLTLGLASSARAARWVQLSPADSTRPLARAAHCVVLDAPGRRLIAWGERIPADEVWTLPLDGAAN